MAQQLTVAQRFIAKLRAVAKLCVVTMRFIVHPIDFLRLYHREAEVANSVLDVALVTIEQEFTERIAALEARVTELEDERGAGRGQ